ncbi:VOC family protein [Tianweitania populi]|uniref:VOC family protein n=1 Tax=Tianweitania populi TaxID=1607949 RepID=A0A8J3DR20_9HYPH|nr:VOC family protein [Tianweitania populi]GHD16320.1 VOC family protein [Tianweitania populi]
MQKLSTYLWFNDQAEEAANFYVATFRNARMGEIMYAPGGGEPHTIEGQVLTIGFEIEGHPFYILNGGNTQYPLNPSVSFMILCDDQEEIDEYWSKILAHGGETMACGWIQDKYGVAWQITPRVLIELLTGPDRERAARVMAAMQQMIKLDIAALEAA